MTRLLAAMRPHPSLGHAANVFDRFTGTWDVDCIFTASDGAKTAIAGEWHFGWILAGRAMQDVLYFYPAGERPRNAVDLEGGTSVRTFDSKGGFWRVSWFAGVSGNAIHLTGGAVDDRIVLQGRDIDGAALRWSFNMIEDSSFTWLGETSPDEGSTWRVEQQMQLRRRQRPLAAR